MTTNRREFIERVSASAAMFGALPLSLDAASRVLDPATSQGQQWDLSWVNRLKGKHKGVFDVPEIENGYGVWRASIWASQYQSVLGVPARDISTVVILRHNGITLAMQQAFWDKYQIGKMKNVLHPVTEQPTDRNPVLLSSTRNEQPAMFDDFALDKFIARGGIALACDLALRDMIELVRTKDGVSAEEARKQATAMLVPGVILQPSGVFAVVRAQEAGGTYVRAS